MISTSEIKISVVIDAKYTELAVRALHDAFIAPTATRHEADPALRHDAARRLPGRGHRASRSTTSCASPSGSTTSASHYVEGGWPGSNPRDEEFFRAVTRARASSTRKVAAFGSTRRAGRRAPPTTATSQLLLRAETPVVTIVGKTWDLHVRDDLRIPLEENLEVIHDSVALPAARTSTR